MHSQTRAHIHTHLFTKMSIYTHMLTYSYKYAHRDTHTNSYIYRYEGLLSVSRDLIFLQAFGRPESIVGDTTERVVSRIMWLSSEFRTTQSLLCIFYSIFETRSDKFFLTRVHHSNMSIYMRQIVEVKVMKS